MKDYKDYLATTLKVLGIGALIFGTYKLGKEMGIRYQCQVIEAFVDSNDRKEFLEKCPKRML